MYKFDLCNKRPAQSAVEIGLILALMAGIAVAGLSATGMSVDQAYCKIANAFGNAECGASALFGSDFNNLDGWTKVSGKWDLKNGELCGGPGEGRIFAPALTADDYVINLDTARLVGGNGYGVFFRAQNIQKVNGYTFQYDPGARGFVFRKWVNGNEISIPIARTQTPANYNWHNVDRTLQLRVVGDTYTALLDGEPILSVSDSTYPSGGMGFRTWYGTQVCFDDLSITRP